MRLWRPSLSPAVPVLDPPASSRESRLRSVAKGLTWRLLATFTTIGIARAVTGHIGDALKIGGVEFASKFLIYYLHERIWLRVPSGMLRRVLDE